MVINVSELIVESNITEIDIANLIDKVSDLVLYKSDNGEIVYTPSMCGLLYDCVFMMDFVYGSDIKKEDIINTLINDKDVRLKIKQLEQQANVSYEYNKQYIFDVIELKKQLMINNDNLIKEEIMEALQLKSELEKLQIEALRKQNTVLEQQIKENEYTEKIMGSFTPEEAAELSKKIMDSGIDKNELTNSIIDKLVDVIGKNK